VKTRPHIIRRLIKLTLWVTCVLFLLVAVLGGGLLWRLSSGPMQVHFLTPYLEDALTAALGGRRTNVHTAVLAWDVGERALRYVPNRSSFGRVTALLSSPSQLSMSSSAPGRYCVAP
jgi:hypothetical protein